MFQTEQVSTISHKFIETKAIPNTQQNKKGHDFIILLTDIENAIEIYAFQQNPGASGFAF